MAQSFLGHVVQEINAQKPKWSKLCFVLPNRRAKMFLQREIAQALSGPLILPEMVSIDDFVNAISTFSPATELQQQRALYQSYLATTESKSPDAFETFLGWSAPLLKDLNSMEQYLLDRDDFFSYLTSLHNIRAWGDENNKLVKNYIVFWELLPKMYDDFISRLSREGLAPPGMCYRMASEYLETYLQHKKGVQFIFCGFNALSPSEEQLVQELLAQGSAQVFWDIDKEMFVNELHQAGVFIRNYATQWPYYKKTPFTQAHKLFSTPKNVTVIEVQQQVGQAKQLGALLENLQAPSEGSKTAVVLADESLLLPLLYALPLSIKKLNISMGFPLEKHPLAVFVSAFLNMAFRQSKKGIYYTDLETVLTLPETYALFTDNSIGTTILNKAKKEHRSYVSPSFLFSEMAETNSEIAALLFREKCTPEQWIDDIITLLPRFLDAQPTQILSEVYGAAAEKFLEVFHQIKEVISELKQNISFSLLRGLFYQLTSGQKLHFVGAPLEGLQILGVLETRTIDFDRVLMAGVNEGILPGQGAQPSWIPYDVKREFGLPTQEEQDAIFTYHFYRLMYRAKEVYLLYNGTTDGIQVGERSRFIRQWEFELPAAHQWDEIIQEATFIPPPDRLKSIPKTESVQQKLRDLAEVGFSPSALNLFIKDGYAFYKRYLLGIKEEDELEEYISHKTYGTLIHNCLEQLYTPYVGKTLTTEDCDQMIAKVGTIADTLIAKIYKQELTGKNVLALAAIKRTIQNTIAAEKEALEKGNTIQLLALEQQLETTRTIPGIQHSIKIRGTIDRVESFNGKIRVLDYKTGKVSSGKRGIYDWSLAATDADYGQARQLLLYALLWNDANPDRQADCAGIIALKAHKKRILFVGEKTNETARALDTEITRYLPKAEKMVIKLLEALFDAAVPFCEPAD